LRGREKTGKLLHNQEWENKEFCLFPTKLLKKDERGVGIFLPEKFPLLHLTGK
jgi:hypothetical protein